MRSVSSGIFFLVAAVVISSGECTRLNAANAVIIDCPVIVPNNAADSFAVNIYITSDVALSSFSVGFTYNSDFIEATSIRPQPLLQMPGSEGFSLSRVFPDINTVGFVWSAGSWLHPLPVITEPAHAFTIWMHAIAPDSFSCVDLDSSYAPGNYIWKFDYDNGTHFTRPALIDCDACEIVGRMIPCGDADGSGRTDIGDLVYLINYIFGGGPGPLDVAKGDFDCDKITRVSDCVYFINFMFASGSPPCASCE